VTSFFRDDLPWDYLRTEVLPRVVAQKGPTEMIRAWCAGCATGQEPYSLAILAEEERGRHGPMGVEILATELSERSLEKAVAGVYSQFEVQRGMPSQLLVRYFNKVGDNWQITPEIRDMVQFGPLNLLHDFSPLGKFEIGFCRNGRIYFDRRTKIAVLERLARRMPADGYLVLGAAETVVGLSDSFRPIAEHRGLFAPNPAVALGRSRAFASGPR